MYPTTYLEWWHDGRWHRIGWTASTPESKRDLEAHGANLADQGGRYRLIQPSPVLGGEDEVVHEWEGMPVPVRTYQEVEETDDATAQEALERHFPHGDYPVHEAECFKIGYKARMRDERRKRDALRKLATEWEREADQQAQWRGRGYAQRLRTVLDQEGT